MTYINFVLIYFALVKSSLALTVIDTEPYKPNWKSIDSRPLPSWYDEAKIGIFLHWGVFSVPSFRSEWFWQMWKVRKYNDCIKFMEDNYPPGFSYQEFAKDFTAELFNATQWAEIFEDAGAKYVVLTTKHHEGFTLWPSEYSYSWNAKDVGPHRDIVDELGKAVRAKSLHYGLYHSLYEWFNPMYLADNASNYQQSIFVERKILPEMKELINNYQPDLLWSDGDAGAPDTYWKATEFLAWLYNESPVKDKIVVNDRWGAGTSCKHGGYYTCRDRYNPGVLQQHKWENAMTLDKHSWGYRRNTVLEDYLTIEELLVTLASTVSCGGNLLINVGPSKDGTIDPIFQDRLYSLGKWLRINGEAIYGNKPWKYQNDSNDVWYTSKNNSVYAIVLSWPVNDTLVLSKALDLFETPYVSVTLLGETGKLKWSKISSLVNIHFPNKATVQSEWSWTLKITKN